LLIIESGATSGKRKREARAWKETTIFVELLLRCGLLILAKKDWHQNNVMDNKIIIVRNLRKSFKDIKAVDDISFEVREGELFAFLGLNGAGKSTTINMLCGNLAKDEGTIIIDGIDIDDDPMAVKPKIGIVFQNSVLDKKLTVIENLRFRAALYGIIGKGFAERLAYISPFLNLEGLYSRTVEKLSGGQRRRIDIARALICDPKILILDEPTTGLDPQTRLMVWHCLNALRKERNLTVFLTTHYMEEAAEADYVVIIDNGHIVARDAPINLKNAYASDYIKV
jgi:multidrug/hemolysin transport system ATP-binding protein